ncbi:MAG: pyridoxamine 5'-phosphate oxidase family protein [Bacteroidota bacterium]
MELTNEVIDSIDKSVLCWLATVASDGTPNVSPKEAFSNFRNSEIIIANIASPQTLENLRENKQVCVSFIDVLIQKGFQIKGTAEVIGSSDRRWPDRKQVLTAITRGKFPFSTLTIITPLKVKPIIAPSYYLFPNTTEEQQVASAKKSYGM